MTKKIIKKKIKKDIDYNKSVEGLAKLQDNKCGICGNKFEKPSDCYLDWSMLEGDEIGGVLCHNCYYSFGIQSGITISLIKKIIKYLNYHSKLAV